MPASAVIVFETGLPPRYYLDPAAIDWSRLQPTSTRTECPYKGRTTGYWSARCGTRPTVEDIAWTYDAPTGAVLAIAGLVGFDDAELTIFVDDVPIAR